MTEDSIFTKIVKGEIPCHKVYEDEWSLAIMDIHPIQPGAVLLISKAQTDHVWDLSDTDYQAVMATAKKVAQRLRAVFLDKARVAMIVEGLDVAHAHLKIFPFTTDQEFRFKPDLTAEPDHAKLAEIAAKLAF